MDFLTVFRARQCDEVVEQGFTDSNRAPRLIRHEIVDVEVAVCEETLEASEAGTTGDGRAPERAKKLIAAVLLLPTYSLCQLLGIGELGSQLT